MFYIGTAIRAKWAYFFSLGLTAQKLELEI